MATYRQVLRQARKQAEEAGIGSEAPQILLVELTNMDNTSLYQNYEEEMPEAAIQTYRQALDRLLNHEPLAYVLGYQWFYGYKMKVSPDVLIPRYETEELVANVLADIDTYFVTRLHLTAADVATGSGNIAAALVLEEPKLKMYATDISKKALKVAKENAEALNCPITFYAGSMLKPLIDRQIKVEVLTCNPPYIPKTQQVDPAVGDFEPHVALFGGDDGLRFYRMVLKDAYKVLKNKAIMAFEIGYDEAEGLKQLVETYCPDDRYKIVKDINGKNRMLFIYHGLPEIETTD